MPSGAFLSLGPAALIGTYLLDTAEVRHPHERLSLEPEHLARYGEHVLNLKVDHPQLSASMARSS